MTRHGRHVSESGLARLYTRSGGNATRRRYAFRAISIDARYIRNLAEDSHPLPDRFFLRRQRLGLATSSDASLSPARQVPAASTGIYHRHSAGCKHPEIDKFVCEIEKNAERNRRKALDNNLTRSSLFH
jgi:hypothetical protein